MAQVDPATRAGVDHLLDQAVAAWVELSDVERDIDSWDRVDQIVFVEEWPLEEERLNRLADYAQSHGLTAEQHGRYQGLLQLVAQRRPIVDRLLRS